MNGFDLRLVKKFEDAVRLHEMRGAQHPEDVPAIERDYEQTKEKLYAALHKLHSKLIAARIGQ